MAEIQDTYTAAELSTLDPFVPTGVLMVERDTRKAKWGTGAKYSTQDYWDPEGNDGVSTTDAIAAGDAAVTASAVLRVSTTTAALEAVANAINTTGKYAGKMVWNATTGLPLWADGAAAADTWSDATGAATHSPV